MRWTSGLLRSQNLEDRRFDPPMNPEQMLALQRWYAEQGDPESQIQVPPWMDTRPRTQEALIDQAASQRALLGLTRVDPTGYDYDSALAAGMSPVPVAGDTKPHWGSRSPAFISPAAIPEGLMLKGEEHPTERLGLEGERAYGNAIVDRDGRQVSVPPWELQPTDKVRDLARMLLGGGR